LARKSVVHAMVRSAAGRLGFCAIGSIAFCSSEDLSAQWDTKHQNTIFCDAITWLEGQGITPIYKHIACSAATLLEPTMQHTLVRVGIMLYGLWPSPDVRRQGTLGKRHVQLLPVLSLKTTLVHIQDVAPGIGWIRRGFKANRPMRGVLP
jgi:alanine racemase